MFLEYVTKEQPSPGDIVNFYRPVEQKSVKQVATHIACLSRM